MAAEPCLPAELYTSSSRHYSPCMIAEAIAPKARARNQAQSIDWLQSLLHTPQQGETRVVQDGMDWQDYLALDAIRDERGGFRVAFLDGVIELMFPSFEHEIRKSNVGVLLEAWFVEMDLDFTIHGSTTLRNEIKQAGKEPDESYAFGDQRQDRPDLAIEVAITSGGIDTLEIYKRWAIPEVWIWQKGALKVFVFEDGTYTQATQSRWFPKLDLALVAECAKIEKTSEARRTFLAALRGRLTKPPGAE